MTPFPRAVVVLAVGCIATAGACMSQSRPEPVPVKQVVRPYELTGTKVRKNPAVTKDAVALIEPVKENQASLVAKEQDAATAGAELLSPAQMQEKRAREIVAAQKELQEMQKRVEFLMHMFVEDERPFLIDPSGQPVGAETGAKLHAEQEELRKVTAQVAVLKARLDALVAANDAAAVKP